MADKHVWYEQGLHFECTRCGKCCTGPPGIVEFTPEEGRNMASELGISYQKFLDKYTEEYEGIPTLKETETEFGFDCVLLLRNLEPDPESGCTIGCRVHAHRPAQCRQWPFWPETMRTAKTWHHAGIRCHGIDHGRHFTREEIDSVLAQQRDCGDPIVPY